MKPIVLCASVLALSACQMAQSPSNGSAQDQPIDALRGAGPVDDGTYLAQIYPLEGLWIIERIDDTIFPPAASANKPSNEGFIHFMEGGFINHSGGCGGSQPAFYALDGQRIAIKRREAPQVGKCPDASASQRERLVNSFTDNTVSWRKINAETLELKAASGSVMILKKPVASIPQIDGKWNVVTIGGKALGADASVDFGRQGLSAGAACNSLWTGYTVTSRGVKVSPGGAATQQGCPAKMQEIDDRLFAAVSGVDGHEIVEGGKLRLVGATEIILQRPPLADRRLAGEYEHCGNTTLGAAHAGKISFVIDRDTLTDNAGCTASYVADGPFVDLSLGASPACGASAAKPYDGANTVEIGGDISPLAVLRPDGFGFDDAGRLILRTNRERLNLCRTSVMERQRKAWARDGSASGRAMPPPPSPPPPVR